MAEFRQFNPSDFQQGVPADLKLQPVGPVNEAREALPPDEQEAIDLIVDLIASGKMPAGTIEKIEGALESARLDRLKQGTDVGAYLSAIAESAYSLHDQDMLYEIAESLQQIGSSEGFKKYQAIWKEAVQAVLRNAADMALPDLIEQFKEFTEAQGSPDFQRDLDYFLDEAYKSSLQGLIWEVDGSLRDDDSITKAFDGLATTDAGLSKQREHFLGYLLESAHNARQRKEEDLQDLRRVAQNN